MEIIKKYTYDDIIKKILGKNVRMTSDCEFFPNFDIKGRVVDYFINNSELVFKIKILSKNKIIDVGSNMKNLKFELI